MTLKTDIVFGNIYVFSENGGMERYGELTNSMCLSCGKWLCVTGGQYTGVVECWNCGYGNVFRNSLKPCEAIEDESRQGSIRRASEQDAQRAAR
jgi:hypothetical protein